MDWMHTPLGTFFRGPVFKTVEGLLFLLGTVLAWSWALLAWLQPALIGFPATSKATVTLFVLWPVCLFAFFVKICAPHFRTSAYNVMFMIAAGCVPFYIAYR